jgi:S1-C subfamily serine protease
MFVEAFRVASSFTRPIVISTRRLNGEVGSVVGSFIVLNADGWIMTAGHIVNPISDQLVEVEANNKKLEVKKAILAGSEPDGYKRAMVKNLNLPKNALTQISLWWGQDQAQIDGTIVIDPLNDLAVARLKNFDTKGIEFPKFKRLKSDTPVPQGKSLLKIGFPFARVNTTFDEQTSNFRMDVDMLTMFPIDGVITRTVTIVDENSKRAGLFLETSSPGLKGMSGGPTVDVRGTVWAIQSQTHTHDLDFIGHNGITNDRVRQFLNVGLGSHPLSIAAVLHQTGVVADWVDGDE